MRFILQLTIIIISDSSDSEISGRYSPVCSDHESEAVDLAGVNSAAAELDAAQMVHELDELIMEDDESVEEEAPLEGVFLYFFLLLQFNVTNARIL